MSVYGTDVNKELVETMPKNKFLFIDGTAYTEPYQGIAPITSYLVAGSELTQFLGVNWQDVFLDYICVGVQVQDVASESSIDGSSSQYKTTGKTGHYDPNSDYFEAYPNVLISRVGIFITYRSPDAVSQKRYLKFKVALMNANGLMNHANLAWQ